MKIKLLRVGVASCGVAAGADKVLEKLREKANGIPVIGVGCLGHCYAEPIVEAVTETGESILYRDVKGTDEAVANILALGEENRFVISEKRKAHELIKVLALAGRVDPTDMNDYIAHGGYEGLKKALALSPEEVVEQVKISGLRGRGGGISHGKQVGIPRRQKGR